MNHSIGDLQRSQPVDSLTHRTQDSRLAIECRKTASFRVRFTASGSEHWGALGRAEDYSGLVRWEVSRFCGSGNRPHLISSCLCDTRRSELIRSNAIVAATIAVRDQTGTFDLVIPEPSSSVSASDNKPGFSRVFGICSPATLRCRRGEKGISQADKRGDFEEPFSGPQIATRAARQSGARPSTTNGKTSASVPHSLVPSSGRIFEALLTSMLREGRRLTEIAADRQRGSHWGNQR